MIQHSCDGCGKPVENPAQLGYLRKCDYCPACAEIAQAFLQARDDMHTNLAKQWDDGLNHLKADYREKLQRLPDAE